MSKQPAIIVDNVSMKFNLSSQKVDNIKEYVIKMLKKELMYQESVSYTHLTLPTIA